MHELSIATGVVETALKHADGRRVTVVNMRVGRLRQVVPDSLRFYFEIVTRDTVCEGARLELEEIELGLRCGDCGREWETREPIFRCARCDSIAVSVEAGDELQVEYIEVEETEAECIGPR
jgi:hydrogenase nickel incorporation protein HypA/HybF